MKTEFKVVMAVAVTLVAVELAIRPFETRLSKDVAHIRSIPKIAGAVSADATAGGYRILFFGNSLTRSGVADGQLLGDLRQRGIDASTYYIYPDGSSITPWTFAYRDQFVRERTFPDVLVVGFGQSHLGGEYLDPTVLSFYAGSEDIVRVLRDEVPDTDAAVEFLLSKVSVAFAHRNRVQPRVFSLLFPHYQEAFQEINFVRITEAAKGLSDEERTLQESYTRLEEFLDIAVRPETKVVFVAIPTLEPYPINEKAIRLIREKGVSLVDLRGIAGIGKDDFPDGYHLGDRGSSVFTSALSEALGDVISKSVDQ